MSEEQETIMNTSKTINLPMDVAREIAKYNDQTQEIERLKTAFGEERTRYTALAKKLATGKKKMLKVQYVDGGGYPDGLASFMEVDIQGCELYLRFIKRRKHMTNNVYKNMTFLPSQEDPDYEGTVYHTFGHHHVTIGYSGAEGGTDCLIDFDKDGVRFTLDNTLIANEYTSENDMMFGGLTFTEYKRPATFIIEAQPWELDADDDDDSEEDDQE